MKKRWKIVWDSFAPDGCSMSRRKQAKPQHINSDEPGSVENGEFEHGVEGELGTGQLKKVHALPRRAMLGTGDILGF